MSAWLWIGAADIGAVGGGVLGPDGFPCLVAALLATCCLVLLVQSVRHAIARSGATIAILRPLQLLAIVLVCLHPPPISAVGYFLATRVWMVPS